MTPHSSTLDIRPLSSIDANSRKRLSGAVFIGLGLIIPLTVLLLSASGFGADGPITTINGLQQILQIGSTATILDAQGNTITVDSDPYKIAIAPSNLPPGLKAGDVLVSNIGNNGPGVSIVKFSHEQSPGTLFNAINAGVMGPSGMVFDHGKLLVANSKGNGVLILNPDGTLFLAITNALFNNPWGIATPSPKHPNSDSGVRSFFTANKVDAKILRVDLIPQGDGTPLIEVVQVGQFDLNGTLTKIDLQWLPEITVGDETLEDVLLATDPANNRVAAFPDSSFQAGTGKGLTLFQGAPLNMPGGLAINPFNNDLLVVNLMDNNLVELNANTGKMVGVKQIDPAVVDNQGNGSALFGVLAIKDRTGNLRVYFTDDNTNSLNVLGVALPPMQGILEKVMNSADGGTTVRPDGNLQISGWAADNRSGAPVSKVVIMLDGAAIGNAMLGGIREDIAAANGRTDWLNSGFSYSYSPAALSAGQHTISAVAYDAMNVATNLGQIAFSVSALVGDYTVTANLTTLTVQHGQLGTVTITATPINGFNSTITFGCEGLPANVTCSFTPPSVTPNGGPVASVMLLSTSTLGAMKQPTSSRPSSLYATLYGLGTFGFAGALLIGRQRKSRFKKKGYAAAALLMLGLVAGCQLAPTKPAPVGTTQITITTKATAGGVNVSKPMPLTLTIT